MIRALLRAALLGLICAAVTYIALVAGGYGVLELMKVRSRDGGELLFLMLVAGPLAAGLAGLCGGHISLRRSRRKDLGGRLR
jgi:hypothetical protein